MENIKETPASKVLMKNCWIVCGPESSGSVFIAKVISFAIGHCDFFGEYSGYGYNNDVFCENLVLHRSLPYERPKQFQDTLIEEISAFSDQYERVNYVLTTRDMNCSIQSKIRRFGGSVKDAEEDYVKVAPFYARLVDDDACYIWSYESMLILGKPYFLRMYRFFGIESDFFPEFYDANNAYFRQGRFGRRVRASIRMVKHVLARAWKTVGGDRNGAS